MMLSSREPRHLRLVLCGALFSSLMWSVTAAQKDLAAAAAAAAGLAPETTTTAPSTDSFGQSSSTSFPEESSEFSFGSLSDEFPELFGPSPSSNAIEDLPAVKKDKKVLLTVEIPGQDPGPPGKRAPETGSKGSSDNLRFLSLLPEETVANSPSILEGLDKKNPQMVADFANRRPSLIVLLSGEELNRLMQQSEVLKGLNQTTIDFMIMSEELASKLEKLPKRTIAKMISANPKIAASFPTRRRFPARGLTERLLHDREFLQAIPVQIHAYLAETEFRHLITPEVIVLILEAHPNLPYFLGPQGRKLVPKLIRTERFLDRAPCATIVHIAVDIDMINSLDGKELTILAGNQHVWQCLPTDVIRNLMRKASIGNKLVPSDLWQAVKAMTSAKGLDSEVVINLLRYQFPDFAASNFGK